MRGKQLVPGVDTEILTQSSVCGRFYPLIALFFQTSEQQNLGKLKTWDEGQGGWRKQRLCSTLGVNSVVDVVCHALASAWCECPSSSGCQRQKLSATAYGSVCAISGFHYKTTDTLLKGKTAERANEFQGYGEGSPWITNVRKDCPGAVCLIPTKTKMLLISLCDLLYFIFVLGKEKIQLILLCSYGL